MSDTGEQGVIELKIDLLDASQRAVVTKVDELGEQLLHPESGLFVRVKDARQLAEGAHEDIDKVREDINKLVDVCQQNERQLTRLEGIAAANERADKFMRESITALAETVKPVAEDYRIRQKRKKWTDKLLWIIISTVIVGLLGTAYAIVRHMIFELPADRERVERLEEKMLDISDTLEE